MIFLILIFVGAIFELKSRKFCDMLQLKYSWFVILYFTSISLYSQDLLKVATVWEYTKSFDYPMEHDKKFTLVLYSDGTYYQTVNIYPKNSKNYTGVSYYELEGDWKIDETYLYLDEFGKKYAIPNDYIQKYFTNVDNFIFLDKN